MTLRLLALIAIFVSLACPVLAQKVTADEALTVARSWTARIVATDGHWAGSTNPSVAEAIPITRKDRVLGYYCRVSPVGGVVISGFKSLVPVKCFSTISPIDFTLEVGPADLVRGGLGRVVDALESRVGSLDHADRKAVADVLKTDYSESWDELLAGRQESGGPVQSGYVTRKVLLSALWDQDPPYNNACPPMGCDNFNGRAIVGCVPLSAAMIMRYWSWPPYGSGRGCDDPYDWPNMPDIATTTSPRAQIDAVAELCAEAGASCDAVYGCAATGAKLECLGCRAMEDGYQENFRYAETDCPDRDDYSYDEWWNLIKSELNLNRPTHYRIPNHTVVVDGWREDIGRYYHINYGWGPDPYTDWQALDAIPGGNTEEEVMLVYIRPVTSVGDTMSGTYGRDAGFPYRYFERDAGGSSATFSAGQNLQFLEGVKVTGTGTAANKVLIQSSDTLPTRLFTGRKPAEGVKLSGASMKLVGSGSIAVNPLGKPFFVRAMADSVALQINISWEAGAGNQSAFEVQRKTWSSGTYATLALCTANVYHDASIQKNTYYYYRIRAVRQDGTGSEWSDEVVALDAQ